MKSKAGSSFAHANLSEACALAIVVYPAKRASIEALVADLREQMEGGGISLEEVKLRILTLYPKVGLKKTTGPKRGSSNGPKDTGKKR